MRTHCMVSHTGELYEDLGQMVRRTGLERKGRMRPHCMVSRTGELYENK